ncbi:MAG: receptor [Cyclobacteriaceae bacterium]|nr:receptor [Cyclobacteriaceae bacterium HetDA_MAG_MS6]
MKILLFVGVCLILLGDNTEERLVNIVEMKFYEDASLLTDFKSISGDSAYLLRYNADFKASDYNPQSAYWCKMEFCIQDNGKEYLFEFYDQTIDRIDLYIRHESDSLYQYQLFGDHFPFHEKPFLHKNFQLMLDEPGGYTAYFRVKSANYADIRVALKTINRFVQYAVGEYFLYGIFYGMILIISLYNVSIYSAIRESKYLYYTFYILSVGVFAMCVDGIAYQYLWPNSPGWNQVAHGVALFSVIFWAIIFSKKFLNLKTRSPKIDKLIDIVLILRSLLFLYALGFDHSLFDQRNIEIIPLLLVFAGSISSYMRGYKPARFFLVAYGILFLGFIAKALLMLSLIPFHIYVFEGFYLMSYYSLHVSFVLEMLFLSIALSDRVRILKRNRDKAHRRIVAQHQENIKLKDRVNEELEAKVKDRTVELAQKNEELLISNELLHRQKDEIAQINSILDLDNWKLRNDIQVIQKERILNKILTYQEFLSIFQDRDICLQFLAEHKWRFGYICKKCKNDKWFEGSAPQARRCTKCGYNETATIGSIFHGVKFPLNKAFYILYTQINYEKISLSELSDVLELRKNTIWSFKKKIEEFLSSNSVEDINIFKDLALQIQD